MTSDNRPNEPGSSYPGSNNSSGGGYPGGGSPLFPGEYPSPAPNRIPEPPAAAPAPSSYPGALPAGQVIPPPPPPRPATPPPPAAPSYPSYPGALPAGQVIPPPPPAAPPPPRPAPPPPQPIAPPAPYTSYTGAAPTPSAPPPPPPPPAHIAPEPAPSDSFAPSRSPGWSSSSGNSYRNGSSTPVRIGGTRRNPSQPSSTQGSYPGGGSSGSENLWGNLGFVIGVSVVACIPMMILGTVLGGIIPSFIPGFVLSILLSLGLVYLLREMPRTALLLPVAVTSMFLLGYAISNSGKPSPREQAVAQKEGKRYDALQQGKAVGQCKDKWERGVTAVGVKDIFRQGWWDAAQIGEITNASNTFEQLATSVNSCLESSPPGLSKAQASLKFDGSLGLYPIQLSDIHTTIAIATKAFALGRKKAMSGASGDDLYQLSIVVRQLDSIGRDPNSVPNTRIGKIPGTGLGM